MANIQYTPFQSYFPQKFKSIFNQILFSFPNEIRDLHTQKKNSPWKYIFLKSKITPDQDTFPKTDQIQSTQLPDLTLNIKHEEEQRERESDWKEIIKVY